MKYFIYIFLLVLPLSLFSSQQQKTLDYIPLSSIPAEAQKTLYQINVINKNNKNNDKYYEVHDSLDVYTTSIVSLLDDKIYDYLEYESVRNIQDYKNNWLVHLKKFKEYELLLNQAIVRYDADIKSLQISIDRWTKTYVNAKDKKASVIIQKDIKSLLKILLDLRDSIKKQNDKIIIDYNVVSITILKIQETISKLTSAEAEVYNNIFYKNELPLMSAFVASQSDIMAYFKSCFLSIEENFKEVVNYYSDNPKTLKIFLPLALFLVLLVLYFNYLYRTQKLFVQKELYSDTSYNFISRPISTLFLLLMLLNVSVYNDISSQIKELEVIVLLIPIFIILKMTTQKKYYKYLYIFFILYVLSTIDSFVVGYEFNSRLMLLGINLVYFALIVYILKHKDVKNLVRAGFIKIAQSLLYIFMFFLLVSIGANILGYELLTTRITQAINIVVYSAAIFYILTTVLNGYVVVIFRRRFSKNNDIYSAYSKKIQSSTSLIIKIFMTLWWMKVVSAQIGFYPYLIEFKNIVLNTSWNVGSVNISVESISNFFIIAFVTWGLLKFVQVILEVEIYPRFKFSRGIPTAISTSLNYIIIISGVILAFSSLGVTSEQYTVVLGALGVGIGFGMRNIVANFISGIIMVFERPIQIGDTVEINNTMGNVQSIGTRSSTLKTFDGSEVIIPNADFIAKEIINWTLSDERRRKTLMFKVDFGSDIELVLEIMKIVATKHKDTLADPEPLATFKGFGDYYLEFKLYYWLTENLIVAQSDIAIEVYKELQKAGVGMPMPRQEFINKST